MISYAIVFQIPALMSQAEIERSCSVGPASTCSLTYDFFKQLVTDGPFTVVLPAENQGWDGQIRHYQMIIKANLYFGTAGDTSQDFTGFEDVWVAVRNALMLTTNWTSSSLGCKTPLNGFSIQGPISRSDLKPSVDEYQMTLTFPGGAGLG